MRESRDIGGARKAFAESLSEEIDVDMDEEFMAASDRVLMRLWSFGYTVLPLPGEETVDA